MATAIQRRRGNTAQHASFTGLAGEITIDTDKNTVVVHDGTTAGGHPLAKSSEVQALGGADITAVVAGNGLTGGATSGDATINVVGGAGITVNADNVAVNTSYYDVTNGGTGWTGNLEPSANNTYSLGSATNVWKDLFVGPNSIRIGGVALSLSNGVLTFGGANVAVAGSASSNADTRALFSATDSGGDGSFSYNSATGVFTYTGPSASEVRAHFSAGTGITLTNGQIATTITQYTDALARGAISATDAGGDGSLSYDNSTGVITYTGPSASEVRAHFSAGTGITLTNGSIAVDSTIATKDYANTAASAAVAAVIDAAPATLDTLNELAAALGDDANFSTTITNSIATKLATADFDSTANTWIGTQSTTALAEGTNLYFTQDRVRGNISVTDAGGDGSLSYNSTSGVITYTGPSASEVRAHFSSGTGVTITDGVVAIGQAVGTSANVIFNQVTADLVGDVTGTVSSLANHDTADLAEGTNLYFTAARARGNISVTDAGGDGSLSYDSGTGVITYTGPSASEVRAHFSAGTGVTITNGSIAIGQAVATTSDVTFKNVSATGDITVSGNLVVNGTTTTINATELAIQDNMIYLNDESNVTNPDIGIVGNYNDGTYAHTGVFRDATDNRWKFFKGLTVEPGQEINTAHASFALSDVQASTFYGELTGNVTGTVSSIANHSTTNLAEGTNLYYTTARANSAIDARLNGTNGVEYSSGTISLASTTAGAGLTFVSGVLGVGAGAGIAVNADNVALSTSGVSAGTYGTATVVPQFTVDAYGRITGVSNVTISADITSVTAGSYLTGGGSTGDVTLNVDATTTATANKVAARDASGDLYANIFQGTASSARYADLAERYEADAILEPGTVVCFGGEKEITACDHENDHSVAGVVSTDPAYMMNSAAGNNDTHPYIALTGRVPVKVVGPVAKGDLLVASGVKGHAMANNNAKAGTIIGKAIGSIDSGEGVVEALINLM